MRSMMRRPRKASLRSPELVIDPSGNASEAAVDSRIGSLGAISLRRFVGAPMVADSLDFVDVAQPVAHPSECCLSSRPKKTTLSVQIE
jgi:hypothetical protein